jgi:hypothetical protein
MDACYFLEKNYVYQFVAARLYNRAYSSITIPPGTAEDNYLLKKFFAETRLAADVITPLRMCIK